MKCKYIPRRKIIMDHEIKEALEAIQKVIEGMWETLKEILRK